MDAPRWLRPAVAVAWPLALAGTALRLLLAPLALRITYLMPWVPANGLAEDQRLQWGALALAVVRGDVPAGALLHVRSDPAFTEAEVGHLRDVAAIVQGATVVWGLTVALLAGLAFLAWRRGWREAFLRGLDRGSAALLAALGALAAAALLAFPLVFDLFHGVLFAEGSWQFSYDSILIRLFPQAFWRTMLAAWVLLAVAPAVGWLLVRRAGRDKATDGS